jgi:exopolyphosphatase / guanosine-5'-triphosphate,3'-diphosphate pyrophosphatase
LQQQPIQLAAIDLGSNSFHMVVATQAQNEIRVQESLSEKVQLGAGLDESNFLTSEAEQRALDCLARFAQRIRGIPVGSVRVVGTNTLRVARNAYQFISRAEQVLGHDIEIVAGREEARLIYLGVSHTLPDNGGDRRLVVDIGGGSTELIIGERFESVETESLHMGCVSFNQRFFAGGDITEKQFSRAITAARREVLSIESVYRRLGWHEAVGASGTIKAIAAVCEENGWSNGEITREGLQRIRKRLLRSGHISRLDLKGVREDRAAIFPAGVAILTGIFEQLEIDQMAFSSGALREGVLYDLIGRFSHEDVRERSIQAMMQRHHVDQAQAQRVKDTAMMLHEQVRKPWRLGADTLVDSLRWAALLHEVGFSVSHAQFHKHGAYLLTHSDLSGFSRQEQALVALLIRSHRRKISQPLFDARDESERAPLLRLTFLLRLAAVLHHGRYDTPLPVIKARADDTSLTLGFPKGWLSEHPLTRADLEQEQEFFRSVGYDLTVR